MSDDAFHEIQLNGKQLIFLSMTAALVLVVAFLSGVLVGRGVRTQKDGAVAAEAAAAAVPSDPTGAAGQPEAGQPAPAPVEAIAPPTPADEDLTYEKRLAGAQPPHEVLKPQGAAPPPPSAQAPAASGQKTPAAPVAPPKTPAAATPPPAPAKADAAKAKDTVLPGEPAGDGYYLKIIAYRDRAQAEAVAKRLTGKGYGSYIVPLSGLYSVRVGKFKTRREADATRRRLEKEERYKPLISR